MSDCHWCGGRIIFNASGEESFCSHECEERHLDAEKQLLNGRHRFSVIAIEEDGSEWVQYKEALELVAKVFGLERRLAKLSPPTVTYLSDSVRHQ
jgi:hypothetical protein